MPRTKRGVTAHARHKKVLTLTKGYRGSRKNVFRVAKQALMKAEQYAYRDRRRKKRDFRRLWITRISAGCRSLNVRYSEFIHKLSQSEISLDRKVLADLAVNDFPAFNTLVKRLGLATANT